MGGVIGELSMQNVGMILVEGVSGLINHGNFYYTTYAATDSKTRFLNDKNNFYSDKLSEFANLCYKQDKKVFMKRMSNIFSTIMIDEVQDMSAWDYEIISHLVKDNSLYIELCGDLRQKTYSTTQSTKFKKYKGRIDLFLQKEVNTNRKTYIDIDSSTLNVSHRFGDGIADFANKIIGDEFPATRSCSCIECRQRQLDFGYDTGAFYIRRSDVFSFVEMHNPLILTWDKNHIPDVKRPTITYSKSKGITVDVCLVYPTQTIINNFLKSSANKLAEQTRCKLYVAVTRARYISAIVVDDDFVDKVHHLPFWSQ
jgi:DNA helicase-2/ATP-dependent DNA helicase PcrA